MKILFLSRWFPYPPNNGSKLRIFHLLRELSRRHDVHLISFSDDPVEDEHKAELGQFLKLAGVIKRKPYQPHRLKALLGFLSPQPRFLVDTFSTDFMSFVQQVERKEGPFDLVVATEVDLIPYLKPLETPVKVVEGLELGMYRQGLASRSPGRRVRAKLTWWKMRRFLRNASRHLAAVTVVSEPERLLGKEVFRAPFPVQVVPNGTDFAWYQQPVPEVRRDPNLVVYCGAVTFANNREAVAFFLADIFPLVRRARPETMFVVTGKSEGSDLSSLPNRELASFIGYVPDIRSVLREAAVEVVPLRSGGGTRLKILEALASGLPVVSTKKGAEGLDLVAGRHFLVADSADEFAEAVLTLLGDSELRQQLSAAGRELVRSRYDWSIIGLAFSDFLEKLVQGGQDTP